MSSRAMLVVQTGDQHIPRRRVDNIADRNRLVVRDSVAGVLRGFERPSRPAFRPSSQTSTSGGRDPAPALSGSKRQR
jgi:hypothetical protein